ncbi:MAG TPA: glycosyltransferase family 4 protein [Xanthobacteraceae bacterium]
MRILHLSPHCDEVGNGVVNVAVDLAIKQREAGHAVGFVSNGGSMEAMLQTHDVRHFRASMGLRRPWEIPDAIHALSSATRSFAPTIVHAHMVPGAVFARALQRNHAFRLISTVHNAPRPQATLMGLANRVIVVSKANWRSMARRGIPERKLRIVKNGPLGSPRRAPAAPLHDAPAIRRPAIVTVARLFAQKGIGDLIAAFALIAPAYPDWSLYLVGAGPEQERFRNQAARTGLSERIHFEGFVRDPRPYLAQADVFVLASRSDPFPLVIPEAREAGCAIIGTAVDGICEGLEDGRAGLLVPPASPAALAKELGRLLRDRNELAAWRERARSNLGWLSLERVVKETISIYEEALSDR